MREPQRQESASTGPVLDEGRGLVVVGQGRMGGAIIAAARATGLETRVALRGEVASGAAGAGTVLICVPDGEIAAVVEQIAKADPPPRHVGHVSGATGLDVLAPAAARGAGIFALHPLQSVSEANPRLAGAACAVGGDESGLELATELARRLAMTPFALAEEQRAAYHAAASMASNFLIALEESAASLARRATGIDGRELLAPLVERTAANWAAHGAAALTGPIARGDEATVEGHRRALADSAPELLGLYDQLASRTRAIAARTSEPEATRA